MKNIPLDVVIPPYSILYWYALHSQNSLDITLELLRSMLEELLVQPNIRIYAPMLQMERITDLSFYRDRWHFSTRMSRLILQDIVAGANVLTLENMDERLNAFEASLRSTHWDIYAQKLAR